MAQEAIDLALNLDAGEYIRGVGAAAAATSGLIGAQTQLTTSSGAVGAALRVMLPRPLTASFVGFTAAAAAAEARLSGMQATAAVTGQNMGRLTRSINDLSRQFPIGARGAQQVVQSLQQAGMAGRGFEGRIATLSKSVIQLGAATGTNASVIGRNMVDLNRAFGNTEMDPRRFSKMSDALTVLAAKSGASSEQITGFSKQIAPLARSVGLGQTSVMGISTAFSKMGEDGMAASNAMNKMLSDINRSLRDGTPELNAYAEIVGTTREQFEGLAKADPTEALTRVTEAIGNAGAGQGQRMLENIGIEGVRGQRAFTALAQSGGIRSAVDEATGGYNSRRNETEEAAAAAMDGLQDNLTRLGSSAEQVAVALGTPLLRPISAFAGALAKMTGGVAAVAGSRPVQAGIQGLAGLATGIAPIAAGIVTAMLARRLVSTVAPIRQLAGNNAVVQSARAASREARGLPLTPAQQRLLDRVDQSRRDAPMRDRVEARLRDARRDLAADPQNTTLQRRTARLEDLSKRIEERGVTGAVRGASMRAAQIGADYGAERKRLQDEREARNAASGRQPGAGFLRSTLSWGREVGRGWNNMMTDAAQQVQKELGTRKSSLSAGRDAEGQRTGDRGAFGRFSDSLRNIGKDGDGFRGTLKAAGSDLRGTVGIIRSSFSGLNREIVRTDSPLKIMRTAATDAAKSLALASRAALGMAGTVGAAAGRGVTGLLGRGVSMAGGGFGIAMAAGFAGYSAYQSNQQAAKEYRAENRQDSVTKTRDAYLESMGKASDATMSFAQQAQDAATQLAKTTIDDPNTVSQAEVDAAKGKAVVQEYSGSASSVAEQINAQFGGRIDNKMLSTITTDLLNRDQNRGRGFDRGTVEDILSMVRRGTSESGRAEVGTGDVDYGKVLEDAAGDQRGTSIKQRFGRSLLGAEGDMGGETRTQVGKAIQVVNPFAWVGKAATAMGSDAFQVGGRFNGIGTTKQQENAIEAVRGDIGQRKDRQMEDYGAAYATQEAMKGANKAMADAVATGNDDLVAALGQQLADDLGAGLKKNETITAAEIDKAGGFVQALLKEGSQTFRNTFETTEAGGQKISLAGGDFEGIQATAQDSPVTKLLENIDTFGKAVSNREQDMDDTLNQTVRAFREMPGDLTKMRKAVDAVTADMQKNQDGLGEAARNATMALNKLGNPNNPLFQMGAAALQQVQRMNQENAGGQGTGRTMANSLAMSLAIAQQAPTNDVTSGMIDTERANAVGVRNQLEDMMRQRVMAEIQYQKQMSRQRTDFNLQREYAEDDFERSMSRSRDDYGVQRTRQIANYNRQVQRQEDDFRLNVKRAEDDFRTGRLRAQRDFNKQLRRMNEDAAKSMYDPYKRIQVQAVSDIGTLMQNLSEQNEAMAQQSRQLDQLRQAGVNNNVIDQLGLNKSENAQQLSRVLGDIAGDPSVAKQLNATIGSRMNLAGALNSDESNKDLQRSKEDFKQSLDDQEKDFTKSMTRQREDFARQAARAREDFFRGLEEMATDFERTMTRAADDQQRAMDRMNKQFETAMERAATDFADAQKSVSGDFQELQKAMQDAMNGNIKTGTKMMTDTAKTALTEVSKVLDGMDPAARKLFLQDGIINIVASSVSTGAPGSTGAPPTQPGSAATSSGDLRLGNQTGSGKAPDVGAKAGLTNYSMGAIARGNTTGLIDDIVGDAGVQRVSVTSVKRNKGDKSLHEKWQAVDYGGSREDLVKLAKYLMSMVESGKIEANNIIYYDPKTGDKYGWLAGKGRHNYNDKTWAQHRDHVHIGMKPDQAKQTVANAFAFAKGGIVTRPTEALIGEAGAREAVIPLNAGGVDVLAKAMNRYIDMSTLKGMTTGQARTHVTYNNYNYDSSTRVTGPVVVQAQDPNEMLRKLQAKARQSNLTATATRRG